MLGKIDKDAKDAKIFCCGLNNRTKNNLFPILQNNVIIDEN